MGVVTQADEERDAAYNDICSAIKHLSSIVIDKVWGADEYTANYESRLLRAMGQLIDIRIMLEGKGE